MILTTGGIIQQELHKILLDQISAELEKLATAPFETVGGFERIRGKIEAYRDCIEFIAEAGANADKRING